MCDSYLDNYYYPVLQFSGHCSRWTWVSQFPLGSSSTCSGREPLGLVEWVFLWAGYPSSHSFVGFNNGCQINTRMNALTCQGIMYVCILRAGVQPTLNPHAEAFIAGPLR